MKKSLLLMATFVASVTFNSLSASAQCAVVGGAPTPVAPTNMVCANSFNASDLIITEYSSQGSLNTIQVVVSRMVNDSSLIVGLSDDGAFSFPTANAGAALPYGDYQFNVFTYNQAELNELAAELNPLLPVLGYPTIPVDANGNVSLSNVFSTLALGFPGLTIEDVEYAICTFLPTLNANLQYGLSDAYTVAWQASGCPVGINDTQTNKVRVITTSSTAIVNLNNMLTATVRIFDLTGKIVDVQTANGSASFDISAYPAGTYLMTVDNGANISTAKFVK